MEYGFWSVVPPLLTIALALVFKNVFVALFVGVFLGTLILSNWNFLLGLNDTFYGFVHTFESNGNTIVLMSLLLIGALIHLIERSGGVDGFVNIMVKKKGLIKSKRGANLFTWLLGIVVFTSGSLSCMVTGSVSRPVNDALEVPHEKSAFIVHATSTPWCVLFPFSGWLASMTGYLTSGGVAENEAIGVLFQSIGLNFYCIIAVVFTLLTCLFKLDFGGMKKAEQRAAGQHLLDAPGSGAAAKKGRKTASRAKPRMANMLLPMAAMVATVIAALLITGGGDLTQGSGMQSLLWGCCVSLFVAGLLCVCEKIFTVGEVINEAFSGMASMLPIACILLFGFTMGAVVKGLDTGNYLSSVFARILSPALLPAIAFVICVLLSFATGTSMGTMSIMSVIAIPMAINMGVSVPLVAGAVFGGAIFGDHASPISDTTIMTCATTGCNIIDHVRTQFPYVAGYAVISVLLYVIMGFVL